GSLDVAVESPTTISKIRCKESGPASASFAAILSPASSQPGSSYGRRARPKAEQAAPCDGAGRRRASHERQAFGGSIAEVLVAPLQARTTARFHLHLERLEAARDPSVGTGSSPFQDNNSYTLLDWRSAVCWLARIRLADFRRRAYDISRSTRLER